MFNDFCAKLTETLSALGINDADEYVEKYRERYLALIDANKSEFESVMALGDPVANAYSIAGLSYSAENQLLDNLLPVNDDSEATEEIKIKDDKRRKDDEKPLTNGEKVFYGIFMLIIACLEIALLFLTVVTGIVSFSYLILAWSLEAKLLVFALALLGVAVFAIFGYIAIVILLKIIKFSKRFGKIKTDAITTENADNREE